MQMVALDSAPIPRFQIYLPPCYEKLSPRRLPVLYLFHGATYDDSQWVRLGAAETADHLIGTAQAEPFIVVMPYNKASWRSPEDDLFDRAVLADLIPYVDAHYRTLTDRPHRAVGGLSRGAGWALRLGITRPDLFGAVGAHSPVVFYADQFHLPGWLADLPAETRPAVYIDIGRGDKEHSVASQLAELLAEYEIPHTWHVHDGNHDETYWQAHIEDYLGWYTSNW
jgi:enterochelin esterase-like enzyme